MSASPHFAFCSDFGRTSAVAFSTPINSPFPLEHYSRLVIPPELDHDNQVTNLEARVLEDICRTMIGDGPRKPVKPHLLAYLEFIMFLKTSSPKWADLAIKHQNQALDEAQSSAVDHKNTSMIRHNLVVFKVHLWNNTDNTDDAGDLEDAIIHAEVINSDDAIHHPSRGIYEKELHVLRNIKEKVRASPLYETLLVTAVVEDLFQGMEGIAKAVAGKKWSLICERVRGLLRLVVFSQPVRSGLAEIFAMSTILRARGTSKDESCYQAQNLVDDLNMVFHDLKDLPFGLSRCYYLGTLGKALHRQFIRSPDIAILIQAEKTLELAITMSSEDDVSRAWEVIKWHPLQALSAIPGTTLDFGHGHRQFTRAFYVSALTEVKLALHRSGQAGTYLDDVMALCKSCWERVEKGDTGALEVGLGLVYCYEALSSRSDKATVEMYRDASLILDKLLFQAPPSARGELLHLRSHFSMKWWTDSREISKLNRAIEDGELAEKLISFDNKYRTSLLNDLAHSLLTKFSLTIEDQNLLERAIELTTEALDTIESAEIIHGDVDKTKLASKARCLYLRGTGFQFRSVFSGDRGLFKESSRTFGLYLTLAQELGEEEVQDLLEQLTLSRCQYWHQTNDPEILDDISTSIEQIKERLENMTTEYSDTERVELKLLLCRCLVVRSGIQNNKEDSKDLQRLAYELQESGDDALQEIFQHLYENDKDPTTLNQTIDVCWKAWDLVNNAQTTGTTIVDTPLKSGMLVSLAKLLLERNEKAPIGGDVSKALNCLELCLKSESTSPAIYLRAASLLFDPVFFSNENLDPHFLAAVTKRAIHLLPRVVPRNLNREDMQRSLVPCTGIASAAAASAIAVGSSPGEALELLEVGRGILARHHLNFRANRSGVGFSDYDNATRPFFTLFQQRMSHLDPAMRDASLDAVGYCHRASKAYEGNRKVERMLEAFEDSSKDNMTLLREPKATDMRNVVGDGLIIVINPSFCCDAIIVRKDSISSFHLEHLNMGTVYAMAKVLSWMRSHPVARTRSKVMRSSLIVLLIWLWESFVEPILAHLDLLRTPREGEKWPRVCWIATGILSQFPFHAAGIHSNRSYRSDEPTSALDCIVSSYSSSVMSLIVAKENALKKTRKAHRNISMVLASMEEQTSSLRHLPYVREECEAIRNILSQSTQPIDIKEPKPLTRETILSALETCDIFHFAGHGASFTKNPDNGCLYLADWKDNPLTVRDIAGLQVYQRAPWLAYLSACSTGTNSTDQLRDEAVHLVGAFQLAGFQHVIGSFWSVYDSRSRAVAEDFYSFFDGQLGEGQDVALALHLSVRKLRNVSCKLSTFHKADETRLSTSTESSLPGDQQPNDALKKQIEEVMSRGDLDGMGQDYARSFFDSSSDIFLDCIREAELVKDEEDQSETEMDDHMIWVSYFHVGL
ncbi:tpr domain-containing protein [Fusarium circinatum]|uniref:Tpr domain-containing protein n=1 Tax=Fusarium circinatum TaxID=48490 RepID=A0A8H5SYI6_FUSCI|nr:tpr domain-containing protein [Fusarium circinatum]